MFCSFACRMPREIFLLGYTNMQQSLLEKYPVSGMLNKLTRANEWLNSCTYSRDDPIVSLCIHAYVLAHAVWPMCVYTIFRCLIYFPLCPIAADLYDLLFEEAFVLLPFWEDITSVGLRVAFDIYTWRRLRIFGPSSTFILFGSRTLRYRGPAKLYWRWPSFSKQKQYLVETYWDFSHCKPFYKFIKIFCEWLHEWVYNMDGNV